MPLEDVTNRKRRDVDHISTNRIDPVLHAIRPEGKEFKFIYFAMIIADIYHSFPGTPFKLNLLQAFLELVQGSRNGIILNWDVLPLKIRPPKGPEGYSFVIRELFKILGLVYKSTPAFRDVIRRTLELAREVLEGREVEQERHRAVILLQRPIPQRTLDRFDSHQLVINLWAHAIEELEEVIEKTDCGGKSLKKDNTYDYDPKGGSGSKSKTQSSQKSHQDNKGTGNTTSPVRTARSCSKEAKMPRHVNLCRQSATTGLHFEPDRVAAAAGGAIAGGIGAGVVLNSMAAAAGAAKTATIATAFAGTSAGKAIAMGTMIFGAPAVILPSVVVSGLLLSYAFRRNYRAVHQLVHLSRRAKIGSNNVRK